MYSSISCNKKRYTVTLTIEILIVETRSNTYDIYVYLTRSIKIHEAFPKRSVNLTFYSFYYRIKFFTIFLPNYTK